MIKVKDGYGKLIGDSYNGNVDRVLLSNGGDAPLNNIFYIKGTATEDGKWLGSHSDISSYYEGLTIAYKIPRAGVSGGTTLNINNLGAKNIRRNDSNLTTHIPANSVIIVVYDGTYFRCSDYDSDTKVRQYLTTTDTEYPLIFRYDTTAPSGSSTYVTNYVRYDSGITINPNTNTITASYLKGKAEKAGYVEAKDTYSFTASNRPNDFDLGISNGFVKSDSGFGNYGSVLTMRTYSGGGGSLQLYAPYSPTYGGTRLKARFGNYEVDNGNSWTDLRTIAWIDDIPTKTSQLENDSGFLTNTSLNTYLDTKLDKVTYEFNKELAIGSEGKVCIGKFPMYDSNVTVTINSTTSQSYHGTLVIATQNINTTGGGSYTATVYGDASNTLTPNIKIKYVSGSRNFEIYIDLPTWSKNLLHIKCVSLSSAPTNIAEKITTIPADATIAATNALLTNFAPKTHNHNTLYYGKSEVDTLLTNKANTDGSNSTGTWPISITGNASTANKATQDSLGNQINLTYVKYNSGSSYQTIYSSGDTPLRLKNTTSTGSTYLGFFNGNDAFLGSLGVNINKQLTFYNGSSSIILDSLNYNTYAPTLNGTGATGSWNIDITGNAATADVADFATVASKLVSPYYYANSNSKAIADSTTADSLFSDHYSFSAMMTNHSLFNTFATVWNFSGYSKYGATQFSALYNSQPVRAAIRTYSQSDNGFGNWREFMFKDEFTWENLQNKPDISTPELPPALANPEAISFKNTNNETVSYDGSVAVDLTSGIYYAATSNYANTALNLSNKPEILIDNEKVAIKAGEKISEYKVIPYAETSTNLANAPEILIGSDTNVNKIAIKAGGQTSNYITIPYATYAPTALELVNKPVLAVGTTDLNAITVTVGGKISDEFTVPFATRATNAVNAELATKDHLGNTISDYYSNIHHTHSFTEITPGNAFIGDGTGYLLFRKGTSNSWLSGMYYHTTGDEAQVFAHLNNRASWIFGYVNPTTRPDWTTIEQPSLHIKNGKVAINKLIPNAAQGAFTLDVNGDMAAVGGTFYKTTSNSSTINTTSSILRLGTQAAGHANYHTGIGFSALYYNNWINHLHAWIGLGPYTTTTAAECYPLVFATTEGTNATDAPIERMSIAPTGEVNIIKSLSVGGTLNVSSTLTIGSTTTLSRSNTTADAIYYASRTDLNKRIGFGIGTSNNRGIYDSVKGWILKIDTNDIVTFSGKANEAGFADGAPWAGITGKPDCFEPCAHQHYTDEVTSLAGYIAITELPSTSPNLIASDTLNQALAKLDYKANNGQTAYDWMISVTSEDSDEYINKWEEITDFLDSVIEGTDILDEFVTRKIDQEIIGYKIFQAGFTVNGEAQFNSPAHFNDTVDFNTISSDLVPTDTDLYSIGSMDYQWIDVYARNFLGNLYGNLIFDPETPETVMSNRILYQNDEITSLLPAPTTDGQFLVYDGATQSLKWDTVVDIGGNSQGSNESQGSKKIKLNSVDDNKVCPILFTDPKNAGKFKQADVWVDTEDGSGYNPYNDFFVGGGFCINTISNNDNKPHVLLSNGTWTRGQNNTFLGLDSQGNYTWQPMSTGGVSFTASPNTVFAGPSSGTSSAEAAFRRLVVEDIPDLSGLYLSTSGGILQGNLQLGNTDDGIDYAIYPVNNQFGYIGIDTNQFYQIYAQEFYEDGAPLASKYAPISHASSATTYGVGTTSNYGHVKISNGDVDTVAHSNGLVAGMDHTHSSIMRSTSITLPATAGWYRIATSNSGIQRCNGLFSIESTVSNRHTTCILNAHTNYGIADATGITVLSCSHWTYSGISKARIVYHTSYSGNYAYLEVYQPYASAGVVTVKLFGNYGWSLLSSVTAGSIPSGYSSKEVALSNNTIVASTFIGSLAGNASTASKLGTTTVGSASRPIYLNNGSPTACTWTTSSIGTSTDPYYLMASSSTTGGLGYNSNIRIESNALYSTNGFYESSDERLKEFSNKIPIDLNKLSKLKKNYFTWKDSENKKQQLGVSAQEIRELYPEIVSEQGNGMLSVAYDKLSVIALAAIDKLHEENQKLKERLIILETKLN